MWCRIKPLFFHFNTHFNIFQGRKYPTSGQAFIREWRRFNKDTKQQYQYLLELGGARLLEIFKPEIGFGLLGDFAKCLHCELKEEDVESVIAVLEHLSETNRFKLTVQFLSSKEKEDVSGMFDKLWKFAANADEERKATFEEKLNSLMKIYEIKK